MVKEKCSLYHSVLGLAHRYVNLPVLHPRRDLNTVMGMLGKVLAISSGVLIGGGVGMYLRENHLYKKKKEQCDILEEDLRELKQIRIEKEKLLEELNKP